MNVKAILWVLVGAVLALTVAVVVVLNLLISQDAEQDYQDCMARQGFAVDEAPAFTDGDRYIDELAAAAERCSS